MDLISKPTAVYIGSVIEDFLNKAEVCMLSDNTPSYTDEEFTEAVKALHKVVKKLKRGKTKGIFNPKMLAQWADMLEKDAEKAQRNGDFQYSGLN